MNQDKNNLLIIFARKPEKGKVKTRLAASIGDDRALDIYRTFIQIAYEATEQLAADKVVFYTEFPDKNLFPGYGKQLQSSTDLGESMKGSLHWAFDKEYSKACIIGTDCPYLSKEILEEAYKQLDKNDFVIGPAEDGGYYLIGMNVYTPAVFDKVEWSTPSVLKTSIDIIRNLGKTYHLLPVLNDIDTIDDLIKYETHIGKKVNL